MQSGEWRTSSQARNREFLAPIQGAFIKSEETQGVAFGLIPVGAFSAESSSEVVFTPMLNFSDYSMTSGTGH